MPTKLFTVKYLGQSVIEIGEILLDLCSVLEVWPEVWVLDELLVEPYHFDLVCFWALETYAETYAFLGLLLSLVVLICLRLGGGVAF